MRPPAPVAYRQFLGGAVARLRIFSQLTTMALRHMLRHPVRSAATALGVAFAGALMGVAMGTIDSIDSMIDAIYFRTERQDVTVTFASARGPEAFSGGACPGAQRLCPFRPAGKDRKRPARELRSGKPPRTELAGADLDLRPVTLPEPSPDQHRGWIPL